MLQAIPPAQVVTWASVTWTQWALAESSLDGLSDILPLGGASVLLVYLLRLIGYERSRWIREREELITEFRLDIAARDADIDRREKDHEYHMQQWRQRYEELRSDYDRLQAELRHLRGGGRS